MLDLQSQGENVLTMSVIPWCETGPGEKLASLEDILLLGFCGYSGLSTSLYRRGLEGEGKQESVSNLSSASDSGQVA